MTVNYQKFYSCRPEEILNEIRKTESPKPSPKFYKLSLKNIFEIFLDINIFSLLLTTLISYFSREFTVLTTSSIILALLVGYVTFVYISFLRYQNKKNKIISQNIRVNQNGTVVLKKPEEISLGDIIILSEGEVVPFDIRVIESSNLKVDESKIFGEEKISVKHAGTLPKKELKLYEISNIVFKNSKIQSGYCRGIVISSEPTLNKIILPKNIIKLFRKKEFIIWSLISVCISLSISFLVFLAFKDLYKLISFFFLSISIISPSMVNMINLGEKVKYLNELIDKFVFPQNISFSSDFESVTGIIAYLNADTCQINSCEIVDPQSKNPIDITRSFEKLLFLKILIESVLKRNPKSRYLRFYLNSILNQINFPHLGKAPLKNIRIIDHIISNNLESSSYILLDYQNRKVVVGFVRIPIHKYRNIFRKPEKYENKTVFGVVFKDVTQDNLIQIPLSELKEEFLILISNEEYKNFSNLIRYFEKQNKKIFFLSSMSKSEIDEYFSYIGLDFAEFESINAKGIELKNQKELDFYLEKFKIFYNLSENGLIKLANSIHEKYKTIFLYPPQKLETGNIIFTTLTQSSSLKYRVMLFQNNIPLSLKIIKDSLEQQERKYKLPKVYYLVSTLFVILLILISKLIS